MSRGKGFAGRSPTPKRRKPTKSTGRQAASPVARAADSTTSALSPASPASAPSPRPTVATTARITRKSPASAEQTGGGRLHLGRTAIFTGTLLATSVVGATIVHQSSDLLSSFTPAWDQEQGQDLSAQAEAAPVDGRRLAAGESASGRPHLDDQAEAPQVVGGDLVPDWWRFATGGSASGNPSTPGQEAFGGTGIPASTPQGNQLLTGSGSTVLASGPGSGLAGGSAPAGRAAGRILDPVVPVANVTAPAAGSTGAVQNVAAPSLGPVAEVAAPVTRTVADDAEPVTRTLADTAGRVNRMVDHTAEPVTRTVADTAEPVTRTVADTTKRLTEAVRPVANLVNTMAPPRDTAATPIAATPPLKETPLHVQLFGAPDAASADAPTAQHTAARVSIPATTPGTAIPTTPTTPRTPARPARPDRAATASHPGTAIPTIPRIPVTPASPDRAATASHPGTTIPRIPVTPASPDRAATATTPPTSVTSALGDHRGSARNDHHQDEQQHVGLPVHSRLVPGGHSSPTTTSSDSGSRKPSRATATTSADTEDDAGTPHQAAHKPRTTAEHKPAADDTTDDESTTTSEDSSS